MGAGADETAESLTAQIEHLRSENVKLRELLQSMGADLPAIGLEEGGVMGAADALVSLMSEGGSLLREREELILEHARLSVVEQAADDQDPDLDRLLEALLEVDALQAEREQLRAERGLPSEEVDDFEDALTRLRPLFNEIDGLRAERHRLASERKGLVEAVEAAGLSAEELLCEEDRDLELQLLNAVKGVAMENQSLKVDIQELQAQISRLRNNRSSEYREALPDIQRMEPVPRATTPGPVPQLRCQSGNTLVLDRPSHPEAPGAFAATGAPKDVSRSGDLEKLQEIIERLQNENAYLKSHIDALSPKAPPPPEEAGEAGEEPQESTESRESTEQKAGDMPEAPPQLPEEAAAEESVAKAVERPAGDMPEAPPPLPDRPEAAEDLPLAPPETEEQSKEVSFVHSDVPQVPPTDEEEPPKVEKKEVKRPRPDELLKEAGVALTPEAMLIELLSPVKSHKVMLPRAELPPEDPRATAIERQEAMTQLLGIPLGRPREEGEMDARSRELSPSPSPKDLDVDAKQAMKSALHSLFRSFGS